MGSADVVPGVSGGTIALILEIYEDFILAIKSLGSKATLSLFWGRYKSFHREVSWDFLLVLLSGMLTAIAAFSHLIYALLNDPVARIYLYHFFIGMIGASLLYCFRRMKAVNLTHWIAIGAGVFVAFFLTGIKGDPLVHEVVSPATAGIANPWLMFCGVVAVCAMMLPGISGSYLLVVLGAYPTVIGAITDFVSTFSGESFWILANVVVGIGLGAILFSRFLSWLLHHYHDLTMAALVGLMIGALRALWPYWTYASQEKGAQLFAVSPYLPDLAAWQTWAALAVLIVGFFLVLGMEVGARRVSRG